MAAIIHFSKSRQLRRFSKKNRKKMKISSTLQGGGLLFSCHFSRYSRGSFFTDFSFSNFWKKKTWKSWTCQMLGFQIFSRIFQKKNKNWKLLKWSETMSFFHLFWFFGNFFAIFMKSCSSHIWGFLNFFGNFQKNIFFSTYSNGVKQCHFFTHFDFFLNFSIYWRKVVVVKYWDFWTFLLISKKIALGYATEMVWNHVIFFFK